MRWIALLAVSALLLAGCSTPSGDDDGTIGIEPDCPRWMLNTRHTESVSAPRYFYHNVTMQDTAPRNHTHGEGHLRDMEDRPLDKFDIEFTEVRVEDGVLMARFEGERTGQPMRVDILGSGGEVEEQPLRFGPGDHTGTRLTVTNADEDGPVPTDPEGLRVVWSFEADRDGNPSTPSRADLHYKVEFFHRDC